MTMNKSSIPLNKKKMYPQKVIAAKLALAPMLCLCDTEDGSRVLASGGEGYILFDFGEEIVARVTARVNGEEAGGCAEFYYGETAAEAMRTEDYPECDWYKNPFDRFVLDTGVTTLESHGRKGFRYLCLRIYGIDAAVLSVFAIAERYPAAPTGMFLCSDETLNRVWHMCAETVGLCMQNYYEDGVKRDGLLWIGDYRLSFPSAWFSFGDSALARESLNMISQSQEENGAIPACCAKGGGHRHPFDIPYMPTIPESLAPMVIVNYCSDYVSAVWEYILLTGDKAAGEHLAESVGKTLDFLWSTIELDRPGQFRWEDTKWEVGKGLHYEIMHDQIHDRRIGKKTVTERKDSKGAFLFQALGALRDGGKIAALIKNSTLAQRSKQRELELQKHICSHYLNAQNIFTDLPKQQSPSILPSVYAVIAGEKGCPEMLKNAQGTIGYTASRVIESQFRAGLHSNALNNIRTHWGEMANSGYTTCWEALYSKEEYERSLLTADAPGSMCHAWTSAPAALLPQYVAGVRCLEPGFEVVDIVPQLGDLTTMECTVPTPHGSLFVRMETKNGKERAIVSVPDGIKTCRFVWNKKAQMLSSGKIHTIE